MATISLTGRNQLVALYSVMFNAAPTATVLGTMVSMSDAGKTTIDVANFLQTQADYASVYPAFMTSDEFATKLVSILLGSEVSAANAQLSHQWITANLNGTNGFARTTTAQVFVAAMSAIFGTTATDFLNAKAALTNKVEVGTYYAVTQGLNGSLAERTYVMTHVTSSTATVTSTHAAIDALTGINLTVVDTAADDTFAAQTGTWAPTGSATGSTLTFGIQGGTDNGTTVSKVLDRSTLSINKSTGAYTLTPNDSAIEALKTTVTDTFVLTASTGSGTALQTSTKTLKLAVQGANDTPLVSGTTTLSVPVNQTTTATGKLTAADRDANESGFQPLANQTGTYGKLTVDADGNLSYVRTASVSATAGQHDTFTVKTIDGTATTVTVNITAATGTGTGTNTSGFTHPQDEATQLQIVRLYKAFLDIAPGYTFMEFAQNVVAGANADVPGVSGIDGLADWMARTFAQTDTVPAVTRQNLATAIATNLHVEQWAPGGSQVVTDYLVAAFNANPDHLGVAVKETLGLLSTLSSDPSAGPLVTYLNASATVSRAYSVDPTHTTTDLAVLIDKDEPVSAPPTASGFRITTQLPTYAFTDTVANDIFTAPDMVQLAAADGVGTLTWGIDGVASGFMVSYAALPFGNVSVLGGSGKLYLTPNNPILNAIKTDQTVTVKLTVTDSSPTPQTATMNLVIHLQGANDPTTFVGSNAISVSDGSTSAVTGHYAAVDRDAGDDRWAAQTSVSTGHKGSFSINEAGDYTYTPTTLTAGQTDTFDLVTLVGVHSSISFTMAAASSGGGYGYSYG